MGAEVLEGRYLQRGGLCGPQYHRRRTSSLQGLHPTRSAQAPLVAGLEPFKSVLRHGGGEVIAHGLAVLEKRLIDLNTDHVSACIVWAGFTTAGSVETRQRVL